jgi:hypothetical protein
MIGKDKIPPDWRLTQSVMPLNAGSVVTREAGVPHVIDVAAAPSAPEPDDHGCLEHHNGQQMRAIRSRDQKLCWPRRAKTVSGTPAVSCPMTTSLTIARRRSSSSRLGPRPVPAPRRTSILALISLPIRSRNDARSPHAASAASTRDYRPPQHCSLSAHPLPTSGATRRSTAAPYRPRT